MPTLAERENLMTDSNPKLSGFKPRHIQKLATRKKPHTMIDIECKHILRSSREDSTHGLPPVSYQMWQEAGKYPPPFPERPDEQYNSNVWRNFRRQYGFHVNSDGQKISEMIANMYPLNIPAPSKVGDYSFEKFLREIPLIKDEKLRRMAIERTMRDTGEFKRLRLRSDSRNPPIDPQGEILPPQDFKKYIPRFIPPPTPDSEGYPSAPPPGSTRIDMFGRTVPKAREQPHMWRLSYKLNHPEYQRIQEEIGKRKSMAKQNTTGPQLGLTNVQV